MINSFRKLISCFDSLDTFVFRGLGKVVDSCITVDSMSISDVAFVEASI